MSAPDFTLNFASDRPIHILRPADLQTIDLSVTRNPIRDGMPTMEERVYGDVRAGRGA